jgi:segregation and condensation protein B
MVPPRLKLVSNDGETAADDNLCDDSVPVDALANLAALQVAARAADAKRTLEALLFAASAPLDEAALARQLPADTNIPQLIAALQADYATRGVNLVKVGGAYAFRTAQDLSHLLERHAVEERKLSKAALETLAIIAYHQPVTRAEVEEIRGVSTSKGSLDVLLETRWIRPRGRRRAPGRPITYGTTAEFLNHFGLDAIKDLPGLAELKGAGLLDGNLPPDFKVPEPSDLAALMPDELPLDSSDEPEVETDPDLFAPLPDEDDEATSDGDGG